MRRIGLMAILLLGMACGDTGGPSDGGDRLIEVVGTAEVTGTPLDTIPEPLTVRVTDQSQRPLSGIPVTWRTADGGSLIPEAPSTNAEGIVRARWVLGWRSGNQQATAAISATGPSAVFSATAEGFQARDLSTGDGPHQCGIDAAGTLYCWGPNDDGQLGNGSTTDSEVPVLALVNQPVSQVVTSQSPLAGDFTCALTSSEAVYCWGANEVGQLGNGTSTPSATPVPVQLPSQPFTALSSRSGGTCAVSTTGEAYCWGNNYLGRFGTGTVESPASENPVPTPVPVTGEIQWRQVSLGDDRACGIAQGGEVYCWGAQPAWLGTGASDNTVAPLPVISAPLMDSITVSAWHQCGITADHVTYCWGANFNIGFEDPRDVIPEPTALVTPPHLRSLHSSFDPTFGIDVDGVGYWWGPPHGATGGPPFVPEPFSGDIRLSGIGLTRTGVCGVEASTSTVYCWDLFSWDGPGMNVAVPTP